ncbi:MarR family winged helix-turn-helix transcriptional regulator [Kribbella deserti]|uniref:MarR family winged helix-turn-helix transcriptional regulator n=1 Tax=Kribbella deserti TaxID=1926257 RepID=A0ABV6QEJ9_9ACTN
MDSVDRMIEAWRRSHPELEVSPLEVVGRLLLCARHLERALVAALKPLGLSFGDFDVLNTLRRMAVPANPTELAAASLVTSGAMTARLDRLVEAGLVDRVAAEHDRRGVRVSLTKAGNDIADKALKAVLSADEQFLAPLDRNQRGDAVELLRLLLHPHEQG